MVFSFRHDMQKLQLDKCKHLPRPVEDKTPNCTRQVQDLLELDLSPPMATSPT